jgi:hypothetical protein
LRRQQRLPLSGCLNVGQPREDVVEIAVRIHAVLFCRLDDGVQIARCGCSTGASGEQEVLSSQHEWADRIFGNIVVRGKLSAIEISHQSVPLTEVIPDRLSNKTRRKHRLRFLGEPFLERLGGDDGYRVSLYRSAQEVLDRFGP